MMAEIGIGKMLIKKGAKFHALGKKGIYCLCAGPGLAVLICIFSLALYGKLYFFDGMAITAVGWILSILLTTIGGFLYPFYFFGLHYMGLGRICQNTEE